MEGLVEILSGKTTLICACKCSEAKVLSIRILYIFVSFFILEKDPRESKSINEW